MLYKHLKGACVRPWFGSWPKHFGLIALLCMPLNINGNVVTVFGSAESEGSVYSVASIYQTAKEHAVSGLALYQDSDGDAMTLFSIGTYQRARKDSLISIGISSYQEGDSAGLSFGISGYQKAVKAGVVFLGVVGCQKAGKEAITFIGIPLYQQSDNSAVLGVGIAGFQDTKNKVSVALGITGYQKVTGKARSFAVWSSLMANKSTNNTDNKK